MGFFTRPQTCRPFPERARPPRLRAGFPPSRPTFARGVRGTALGKSAPCSRRPRPDTGARRPRRRTDAARRLAAMRGADVSGRLGATLDDAFALRSRRVGDSKRLRARPGHRRQAGAAAPPLLCGGVNPFPAGAFKARRIGGRAPTATVGIGSGFGQGGHYCNARGTFVCLRTKFSLHEGDDIGNKA